MTNFSRNDFAAAQASQPAYRRVLSAADLLIAANAAELKAANYAEFGDSRSARLQREISRMRRRTAECLVRVKSR